MVWRFIKLRINKQSTKLDSVQDFKNCEKNEASQNIPLQRAHYVHCADTLTLSTVKTVSNASLGYL